VRKKAKIGKLLIAVAVIALLSAFCASAKTAAIPVPIQAKLSGEPPTFSLDERWTYNYTFTNMTSSDRAQTTIYANTTGSPTRTNDYYGGMRDCYVLWFRPVDPHSTLILLNILSNIGITDLNVSDIVGLGNSSVLKLYLSINTYLGEYNFSWIKSEWNVNYDAGGKKLNASLTIFLNVTCSHSIFNFTLYQGKTFGNYTEALNIKLRGYVYYYNGTWNNLSHYIGSFDNLNFSFPDTYLFYPAFSVEGIEMVNVSAGTFECWRIAVLNATNPSENIGYYWYSPAAKNYVKMNVTGADSSNNRCNIYVELTGKSTGTPFPGIMWGLLMFLLLPYLAVSNIFQQQQMSRMLLVGVAVLLIVAAVVGVIVATRRKQK